MIRMARGTTSVGLGKDRAAQAQEIAKYHRVSVSEAVGRLISAEADRIGSVLIVKTLVTYSPGPKAFPTFEMTIFGEQKFRFAASEGHDFADVLDRVVRNAAALNFSDYDFKRLTAVRNGPGIVFEIPGSGWRRLATLEVASEIARKARSQAVLLDEAASARSKTTA